MMKKNGFTLAEVLITLAIIGVVATLTLPALMSNTAEQQSIAGFRKIMNSLNEAAQMNGAIDGFGYDVATIGNKSDTANNTPSLWGLFNERLQVSRQGSDAYGKNGTQDSVLNNQCGSSLSDNSVIVLRDGTSICLQGGRRDTSNDVPANYWLIYVDANGPKGPNQLSYCKEEGCTKKTERFIKDQFPVTLSRGIAVPGHWSTYEKERVGNEADYAARFAMGIGKNNTGG